MKRQTRHVDKSKYPRKFTPLDVKEFRKILSQARTPKQFKEAKAHICEVWGINKDYLTRLLAEEE